MESLCKNFITTDLIYLTIMKVHGKEQRYAKKKI